jgi:hypothetical protein
MFIKRYRIKSPASTNNRSNTTGRCLFSRLSLVLKAEWCLSVGTSEKRDQAEILRFKGEALLMRDTGAITEAEKYFRQALELARAQDVKWWELRTSVGLARLMRVSNRCDEARSILTEIYNWFTEGFDLPDLKEAKALLDELNV